MIYLRRATVREMKEGPSGSVIRSDLKPPQAATVKSRGGVVSRRRETAMLYER